MAIDPVGELGEAVVIEKRFWVGGGQFGLIKRNAQAQAGGAAAILHTLAQIEKFDLFDRRVALADQIINIIADGNSVFGFGG